MVHRMQFYIDGAWVDPVTPKSRPVVNPATEQPMYDIALGSAADVDKAVAAARRAFETFSQTTREERVALLTRIVEVYKSRMKDIGAAVSDEMGAPIGMAEKAQAGAGLGHIMSTLDVLKSYHFEEQVGSAMVVREPVGVVGMITPWNWPLNQIACKVAPALAAGCTMILKPSEFTPSSALIFAEILHEAGVPKGVFNLINGLGQDVGAAMSAHPGIDMISFTAPPVPASMSLKRPRSPSSASARNWAANRPTSSWKTPTCKRPSPAAWPTCSTTPVSPAMRPLACWCRSPR
jgi:aldehyde dehydrogenase (NAD+)